MGLWVAWVRKLHVLGDFLEFLLILVWILNFLDVGVGLKFGMGWHGSKFRVTLKFGMG